MLQHYGRLRAIVRQSLTTRLAATVTITTRYPPHSCHRAFTTSLRQTALIKSRTILQDASTQEHSLGGLPPLSTEPTYPSVLAQVRSNMLKFENCIVLTRIGGFYEVYFEQAEKLGPLLNLKVAQRHTAAGPVAMAGFPFMQLEKYLKILVQDMNQYVAVAEEFPNDAAAKVKSGGNLFDRKVSRVVTPGTLIDENFMDPYTNNYILAVHLDITTPAISDLDTYTNNDQSEVARMAATPVGIAWLDLSTGQFVTQSSTISMLGAVISRVGPREIVIDEAFKGLTKEHPLFSALADDQQLITYVAPTAENLDSASGAIMSRTVEDQTSKGVVDYFTIEEKNAGNQLLQYIDVRLQGSGVELQSPTKYSTEENMIIDKNTMRALELRQTLREYKSTKGTLLHAIKRTVTKSGARLLDERLSAPSTSVEVITERLNLVSFMLHNRTTAEHVVTLLGRSDDSKRLAQKFAYGRGTADDLIALSSTILATRQLRDFLHTDHQHPDDSDLICISKLISGIELASPLALAERIKSTIDEDGVESQQRLEATSAEELATLATQVSTLEGSAEDITTFAKRSRGSKKKSSTPTSIREHYANEGDVWTMKPTATPALSALHEQLQNLTEEKMQLTEELQQKTGVAALSLRWTPGLGHICHLKPKQRESPNLSEFQSVSSSKSTQSYHHPHWTLLGKETDQIKLRIRSEESALLLSLRQEVVLNLFKLRKNAGVLDELDIACSFATLAKEQNLTRPILNNGTRHKIVGGRHPTVQSSLTEAGRSFITNDCFVGAPESIWLITGPNMAGKSTFLRQNALITIMAQIGSYVPAEYCEIGIVDQIFSRVGSADNLFQDQSTFMVEMLESAMILKQATESSFVIMDEIGRGTTPEDGIAVAFACVHHLYHVNKCRTLFATHFHSLAEIAGKQKMNKVGFYCTDVTENGDGEFSYVHRLRKGVNRQSHALKVARIAGVPEAAVEVAEAVLSGRIVA